MCYGSTKCFHIWHSLPPWEEDLVIDGEDAEVLLGEVNLLATLSK